MTQYKLPHGPRRSDEFKLGTKGKVAAAFAGAALLGITGFGVVSDFTYSNGDRQGVVTKLSKKGILCRTWEGELAMRNFSKDGTLGNGNRGTDNTFYFSVDDNDLAERIRTSMRQGKGVTLDYEQKLFPLSLPIPGLCQRRTEYEINDMYETPNVQFQEFPMAPAPRN